jgi:hypothetical protein
MDFDIFFFEWTTYFDLVIIIKKNIQSLQPTDLGLKSYGKKPKINH